MVETLRRICEATEWDYAEAWLPAPGGSAGDGEGPVTGAPRVGELAAFASWMHPAASGLDEFALSRETIKLRVGRGLPGRAWESGRPIWVTDLGDLPEAQFCRPTLAARAGLRAAAVVPVLSEGRPIAALLFAVRRTRHEDLHLLELVRVAVAPIGEMIQRKAVEEQLAQHRRELEQRVEQRTGELLASQQQLRMADRMASIGTLAAGLGHDMNNVLLPVRAHLNALRASGQEGAMGAPDRKHVEAIRKSVGYLQQLADGLHFLAMDPDAQGDVRGGGETTDLTRWWTQAGPLLAKAVPKHVQVTCAIPEGLPPLRVPSHGLTQAVLNLIVNAGEAIPPPGERKRRQGRVRVGAGLEGGGAAVRIVVADNGTGMTEEVRRRAFELFFTTKPRGLGTGLGLSLVQKVVDGAGGHVEVETELGKGTTVAMLIPVVTAAAPGQPAPEAVVAIADGRARALIGHLLDSAGIRVRPDGRGEAADIWVVEPSESMLAQAVRWRSSRPRARVVLLGRPPAASAAGWESLTPVCIEDPHDLDAVRAGLARAAAGSDRLTELKKVERHD
jgi:signal transduction histidine kinase